MFSDEEARRILDGSLSASPSVVRRVMEEVAVPPTRFEKCSLGGCEERSEVENSINIPLTSGWLAQGQGPGRLFFCCTADQLEYSRRKREEAGAVHRT